MIAIPCWRIGPLAILAAVLTACGSPSHAPVVDRPTRSAAPARTAGTPAATAGAPTSPRALATGTYQVKKGDTLQSIATDTSQDYKDLVAWNKLDNPNMIRIGQVLRVSPPDGVIIRPVTQIGPTEVATTDTPAVTANTDALKHEPRGGKQPYSEAAWVAANRADDKGITSPRPVELKPEAKNETRTEPKEPAGSENIDWNWPAGGKIVTVFAEGSNKGVGIGGKVGDTVMAAAAGKVLYAGEDLRGYGKLVVLKHNANFLSVYAHNSQILVKEGQMVAKGEKIAELGRSDSDQPKLHFEIRRQGKPVDPVKFLPAR